MIDATWQVSPILGVARVRRAAEYYRDVLGFDLDPEEGVFQPSPDEPDGVYAIVKRAGVWVHFQIRRGEIPRRDRPPYERDVYVYVDDVSSLHDDLSARGARIVAPPHVALYGLRELVVEDLDGYRIAFGEPLS
jgi:uncharacterized glyoxalase superfamily protein PhnB